MFNVRLAGGHLYGKQLFTWLSLVVSLMASFVLSFFPLDVLDEIWDLIESVSEGFLTYSSYILLATLTAQKYKARFIANSSSCTTTELSSWLPLVLLLSKIMLLIIVKKSMKGTVRVGRKILRN